MKYIIFKYCSTNMNIYKYCLNFAIETVNEIKYFFNIAFSEVRYKLYVRKRLNKPVYSSNINNTTTLQKKTETAETAQTQTQTICDYDALSTRNENKFEIDDLESGYESDGLSYGHESDDSDLVRPCDDSLSYGDESEIISKVIGDEKDDLNYKKRVYESDENSVMSTDEIAENIYTHNINYKNCISEIKNIKKVRFE
jgi:hypothetical protein